MQTNPTEILNELYMKILHINAYTNKKNLTFPHYTFHKTLREKGHDSRVLSFSGDLVEHGINYIKPAHKKMIKKLEIGSLNISRITRMILFKVLKKDSNNEYYFYPEWNLNRIKLKRIEKIIDFKPEVIVCYWTKFFFNTKLIYNISKKYNSLVFYYFMDMAPLTGGCHYSNLCLNYQNSCGNCPALNSKKNNDLSYKTLNMKAKIFDKFNPIALYGSGELKNQIEKSSLWKDKKKYELILGVDEMDFSKEGKDIERKKLGIGKKEIVILYGSTSITDKRKGFNIFLETIKLLENKKEVSKNIVIVFIGNGLPSIDLKIKYLNLGYASSQKELAIAYKIADVFVSSSISDSGPLMVNQSIMAGTPVVAFNVGVASDLVIDNETGFIASNKNPESLCEAIVKIISKSDLELKNMSKKARELGLKKFTNSMQAYHFEEIVKENLN